MRKLIGGFVACLVGLMACNVEHYEDCDTAGFDDAGTFGGSGSGLAPSRGQQAAGSSTAGGQQASGGADAGQADHEGDLGGAANPPAPGLKPCGSERDCDPGFNCDLQQQLCQPSDEETCGELATELACTHRSDCTPIYAGTHCSCGQDCECHGGDPGCVCQTFEFFGCQASE